MFYTKRALSLSLALLILLALPACQSSSEQPFSQDTTLTTEETTIPTVGSSTNTTETETDERTNETDTNYPNDDAQDTTCTETVEETSLPSADDSEEMPTETSTSAVPNIPPSSSVDSNLWDALTEKTYNLLDPTTIEAGYLTAAGNLSANTSFFTSEFIPATPGETVRIKERASFYSLCFYNSEKEFISRVTESDTAIVPDNTAFMRICFLGIPNASTASNHMVYLSDTVKPFIAHRIIKASAIPAEPSPYPDVKLILPRRLIIADGISIAINHQSVVQGWDVQKAVSANIQYNTYPTYGNMSVITGGAKSDRTINFLFTPSYEIGMLQQKMEIVNVSADAGSGQTKKVLFIGDSKTDANQYTQYLLDMFAEDSMNIELLGTRGNSAQNRHEGRSGWSAENYVENNAWRGVMEESPFWNPTTESFDFAFYMEQNGYDSVDYVFINLGTNDSVSNFIDYYKQMIDEIKAYDPSIIIGLWTPAPFATFGGYTHVTNDQQAFIAIQAILDEFDTDEYANNGVYVVPTHLNINTFYDFAWVNVPYNNMSSETYRVCTDQIHETYGYQHDADVIFGYIKYFATLS